MQEKTPQPQSEKKHILTPEDRLTPELRAKLEPEFKEVVATVTKEQGRDDLDAGMSVVPFINEFRRTLAQENLGFSKLDEERLFWELVGNELASSIFLEIRNELELLVDEGKTKGLENQVNLLIGGIVKDFSGAVYRDHTKRAVAVIEIKRKLIESLPSHLKSALAFEKKETIIRRGEQAGEELGRQVERSREEAGRGFPSHNPEDTVEHCTWDVPDLRYVRPGATLEVEYSPDKPTEGYKILEGPHEGPNGRWIVAQLLGAEKGRTELLAQFGMEPYPDGRWDKTCRPVRCGAWQRKQKEKQE